MSKKSLNLVVQKQISNSLTRHGKGTNKIRETYSIRRNFSRYGAFEHHLSQIIDETLGKRSVSIGTIVSMSR